MLSLDVLKCELIVGAVELAYSTLPNLVLTDAKLTLLPAVVPPSVSVVLFVPVLILTAALALAAILVAPLKVAPPEANNVPMNFVPPLNSAEYRPEQTTPPLHVGAATHRLATLVIVVLAPPVLVKFGA